MFQKLTIYTITAGLPGSAGHLATYLQHSEFTPTTPNQELASGFEPPREKHGEFAEGIGGHWIARAVIETRKVPGDTLQRRMDTLVEQFEATNGRKPGSKMRREMRDAALAELLPQAFPKQVRVPVWIDPNNSRLYVGTTSDAQADRVIMDLVRSVPDLHVSPLLTNATPANFMSELLREQYADGFDCGHDVELRASDDSKAVVRYKNRNLNTDEVQHHIGGGMYPAAMSMALEGRVGFTLTDGMKLKGIEFLEVALSEQPEERADAFDADVAITTGELSKVVDALIYALGGLYEPTTEKAAA